jgi:SM-20-related protein
MRAMHISSDHPLLLRIVDDLYAQGWSQQNIFLPEALTLELAAECHKRSAEGELTPAAVGRGPESGGSRGYPRGPYSMAGARRGAGL